MGRLAGTVPVDTAGYCSVALAARERIAEAMDRVDARADATRCKLLPDGVDDAELLASRLQAVRESLAAALGWYASQVADAAGIAQAVVRVVSGDSARATEEESRLVFEAVKADTDEAYRAAYIRIGIGSPHGLALLRYAAGKSGHAVPPFEFADRARAVAVRDRLEGAAQVARSRREKADYERAEFLKVTDLDRGIVPDYAAWAFEAYDRLQAAR